MRIVSLVPSITETLFELGLDEEIVGITSFCIHPKDRVIQKTKIGGTKNPDREKILALKPDVILLNEEENRKEDADFFHMHEIPMKITFPSTVLEAAELIENLGKEFNVEQKATSISTEIIKSIEQIQPVPRFRTLILIWKRPYWTVNKATYVNSICETVGLDNVFADSEERYPHLSSNQIQDADPEIVLFPDEPYVFREKDVEEFAQLFPKLNAVRQKHLIQLDGSYLTWHGVRTLTALHELPRILEQAGLWN